MHDNEKYSLTEHPKKKETKLLIQIRKLENHPINKTFVKAAKLSAAADLVKSLMTVNRFHGGGRALLSSKNLIHNSA